MCSFHGSLSRCQNPCCSRDVYSVQYPCLTSQTCHLISRWSVQTCCGSRSPDEIHGYNSDAVLWDQADLSSSSSASLVVFAEKQVPVWSNTSVAEGVGTGVSHRKKRFSLCIPESLHTELLLGSLVNNLSTCMLMHGGKEPWCIW